MPDGQRPEHIVGYELGFEGEVDWDRPVVFPLDAIDRIDRAADGRARFTIRGAVIDPVAFVTKSPFEEVIEQLRAIH
jgi:hypothetical protein